MGCLDVIRILLASINVFLNGLGGLYGLALIAQGSAGLILFNIIGVFSDNEHLSAYNTVFFFTLAMGVVLLLFCVVAIIGSCVACCPNNSILKVVASVILTADLIAVFFCFLLGIAGAVLVFVYRDTVTAGLIPVLHEGLIESYTLAPKRHMRLRSQKTISNPRIQLICPIPFLQLCLSTPLRVTATKYVPHPVSLRAVVWYIVVVFASQQLSGNSSPSGYSIRVIVLEISWRGDSATSNHCSEQLREPHVSHWVLNSILSKTTTTTTTTLNNLPPVRPS